VAILTDYAFTMRNVPKVHLSVHATNERAIRAYEAVGFVVEGRLREHAWSNGAYVDLCPIQCSPAGGSATSITRPADEVVDPH